ncbi:hypothetical protein [Dyadobacter jiangsuensis]|uniref:Outer membrane protein with beta-barrel domain n=1 Tax=Dyadobacter jiangsuensis TaxID=1591085 RepID=A0A2P8GII3_9BACT|nr:hypothetical protein [Dyadobacter jiangsuensis]PSL33740.1 hypothetical protein CLV60_101109 [Dyadobacter jiangsuensis]
MSDQEPVGKRMLGQLRDHTEPYRPEAWEHFEMFRAAKSRKRRTAFYWLSAAALLVIFGTALLTKHVPDQGIPAKPPVAQKHTNGRQANREETAAANATAAPTAPEVAAPQQAAATKQTLSKHENRKTSRGNIGAARDERQTEYPAPAADYDRKRSNFNPGPLPSRPFNSPILHFSQLRISLPQQPMQVPPQPARPIRWGIAVSPQSNRAAHTDRELNYGLGGALLVPLSGKIALAAGISGSKQSLTVEAPERLVAAEGSAQLQHVRYQWLNLEIPLQIQYKLRTFKSLGLTASGGIALQSTIGQQADYLYKTRRTIATYAETGGGPVLVSTQTIEELSSVTENDKKRTWAMGSPLYFGLGISYQRPKIAIEIEPYIKYPLGTSTAQRLNLTTIGIQLRLMMGKQ